MWKHAMMLVAASVVAPAHAALAQGTVSGQGFGYPVPQQSARAAGTAGALGVFDELSPSNPAPLALWPRMVLFSHYEPERRSTEAGGGSASTRLGRFPLIGAATRVGRRAAVAVSASTYLDRTWETVAINREVLGDREVDVTTRYSSDGAINDIRAAFAWAFTDSLRAGVAYHAYTGSNRMRIGWDFPELEPFGDVDQTTTLAYGGSALSAGVDWRFGKFGVAAYQRFGGSGRVRSGDTLIAEGDMPDHSGFGVRYDGLAGTVFAAGWERVGWTAMRGMGSPDLRVRDSDRISVGLETAGPRLAGTVVAVRLGFSQRTLPFDAAGSEVSERTFAAGAGYPFASNRGSVNVALQRASRDAGVATERAWLFGIGFTISP